jgi:PTS system mannose-specific IIA component
MIGLVIVTHGRLAVEFRAALEHVVGPQSQIEAISIGSHDDADTSRQDILAAVEGVDTGDGVVILTDMFGQTPSNLAVCAMGRRNVEIIAGINLPMIIKLAQVRRKARLAEAIVKAEEAGRIHIRSGAPLPRAAQTGTREALR